MSLFVPSAARWGLAPLDGSPLPLLPGEAPDLRGASDVRRREFAAGRHLARRLIRTWGCPAAPLRRRRDGSPNWPEGLSGSISHCQDLCVVAVAPVLHVTALGIDVEPAAAIEEELWQELFHTEELLTLRNGVDLGEHVPPDRLLFSAKEAAYKSGQAPRATSFLDLRLVHATAGTLRLECLHDPALGTVDVSWRGLGNWLLTTSWIEASASSSTR